MGPQQATARDDRDIELQLAAVTGRLHAHQDHQRDPARTEELDGQRAALAWLLRLEPTAPVTLRDTSPDAPGVEAEFIAAGRASLDPASPAHRYALGAYEALRWNLGQRGPLVPAPTP